MVAIIYHTQYQQILLVPFKGLFLSDFVCSSVFYYASENATIFYVAIFCYIFEKCWKKLGLTFVVKYLKWKSIMILYFFIFLNHTQSQNDTAPAHFNLFYFCKICIVIHLNIIHYTCFILLLFPGCYLFIFNID